MSRWGLAAGVWIASCALAFAEPSPLGPLPAGWTATTAETAVLQSPAGDNGTVTVILPLVLPAVEDLSEAFANEVPALIEDLMGEIVAAEPPRVLPAGTDLTQGVILTQIIATEDGAQARIDTTGYKVPGGLQLVLVARPAELTAGTAQLIEAQALVERWRAGGFVMTPDRLAAIATALASTAPGAGNDAVSDDLAPAGPPNPDEQVESLIHYLRYDFDAKSPDAAAEPQTVTVLLLRDGRAYEGEARAPAAFDPASRPEGSPGAGRWEKDGEGYALVFGDGTEGTAVASAAKTHAAPAAMTITGTYTAIGASAKDDLSAELKFFDDGSLTLTPSSGGAARSGTYAISQRTIEIRSGQDAKPAVSVFGFQGDRDRPDLLVIGNRIYERATEP